MPVEVGKQNKEKRRWETSVVFQINILRRHRCKNSSKQLLEIPVNYISHLAELWKLRVRIAEWLSGCEFFDLCDGQAG